MSQPLRLVFMGTPDFAVPSLQALLDGPDEVVAVVCQPDRQRGRGKILSPPPVKVLAKARSMSQLDLIEEVKKSGLSGRGVAGFDCRLSRSAGWRR